MLIINVNMNLDVNLDMFLQVASPLLVGKSGCPYGIVEVKKVHIWGGSGVVLFSV